MFETLSRSWSLAMSSFRILLDHKQLLLFPIISTVVLVVVLLTFLTPLWATGALETLMASIDDGTAAGETAVWVITFIYYFISFFIVTFFNTALIACALRVIDGESPTIGYGLSVAFQRLPQIAAWALVAAVVGLLIKMAERHRKIGSFVAAILGTAWSALTFFVVPVLAAEGVGPIEAIKRSAGILRHHWGTSLVSNFSLGIIGFLLFIPVGIIGFLLFMAAVSTESGAMMAIALVVTLIGVFIVSTATTAADVVLKAVLYNYATGRTINVNIASSELERAFVQAD